MQKSIVVELSTFRILVSEYGELVRTISNFSIGREGHRTPIIANGALHPTKRDADHHSSSYPPPHGGAPMPYALFFREDPAAAFHQGSTALASHGCIHLPMNDARWLFTWAGASPVGLDIRGPYPASPLPPQRLYGVAQPNMRTEVIRAIQDGLTQAGHATPVTGEFDLATDASVRAYQAAQGLLVDGIVGPDTAGRLGVTL